MVLRWVVPWQIDHGELAATSCPIPFLGPFHNALCRKRSLPSKLPWLHLRIKQRKGKLWSDSFSWTDEFVFYNNRYPAFQDNESPRVAYKQITYLRILMRCIANLMIPVEITRHDAKLCVYLLPMCCVGDHPMRNHICMWYFETKSRSLLQSLLLFSWPNCYPSSFGCSYSCKYFYNCSPLTPVIQCCAK